MTTLEMIDYDGNKESVNFKQNNSEKCLHRKCVTDTTDGLVKETRHLYPKCETRSCINRQYYHSWTTSTILHEGIQAGGASKNIATAQMFHSDPLQNACEYCSKRKMLFFCADHEMVVCSPCCRLKHKNCKISFAERFCQTQNDTEIFDIITSKINELVENLLKVYASIESKQKQLEYLEGLFEYEIENLQLALNNWLDIWEDYSIKDPHCCSGQRRSIFKECVHAVSNLLQCLNEIKEIFSALADSGTQSQVPIMTKKLQHDLDKCNKEIRAIKEIQSKTDTCSSPNTRNSATLHSKLDNCLEHAAIRCHLGDDVAKKVFSGARPLKIATVIVKQPDKIRSRITSIVFTCTDYLLAADSRNTQLLLLNTCTMTIQGTCKYPKSFFYIHLAPLNEQSCVSLVPGQKELQFIQIKPRLCIRERKQLDNVCHAMTATKENIFLLCSSETPTTRLKRPQSPLKDQPNSRLFIFMMNTNGDVLKIIHINDIDIKLSPTAYYNMAASLDGQTIFLAQNKPLIKPSIICMTLSGKHVFSFEDLKMKGIRSIIADAENNFLVCSETPNMVFVLTPDGNKQDLLTLDDDICNPCTMAFRSSDGLLVIGDEGETGIGDRLSMFKIKYM